MSPWARACGLFRVVGSRLSNAEDAEVAVSIAVVRPALKRGLGGARDGGLKPTSNPVKRGNPVQRSIRQCDLRW